MSDEVVFLIESHGSHVPLTTVRMRTIRTQSNPNLIKKKGGEPK